MSDTSTDAWDFYAHDIEACPFCGSFDLRPWSHQDDPDDPEATHWTIWCCYCGAEGPVTSTPQEATDYWNKRD